MGETKVKNFLKGIPPESSTRALSSNSGIIQALDPKSVYLVEMPEIIESLVEKKIKPILEFEVEVLDKSAETTLERVQANIAIIVGICLSTGLAPWTSIKSTDATSAQLGSYALLLSVSTEILALTRSFSYFSTATGSARMLLKLKENMLSVTVDEHFKGDNVQPWNLDKPLWFGFSCSSEFSDSIYTPSGRRFTNSRTGITGYLVTTQTAMEFNGYEPMRHEMGMEVDEGITL
ncbi:hypothetical protein F4679DRAFT_597462 [Xylaria curta]|nr:hypothetical protein F4679DRAFT_597462 [Xylaria curta]